MEKNIIVGIDFSKGSVQALKYAISIANKVKTNIIMVYVSKPYKTDLPNGEENETRQDIQERFDELVKEHKESLESGTLSYKIRIGKIYQEIAKQAKFSNAFLIVVGTHGGGGFEKFWIGSNAYRVISYAPCPVITVCYNYKLKNSIKTIVMPIDSTLETRQKVPFATALAKNFGAKIHILALYTSHVKAILSRVEGYAKQTAKYLDENRVDYEMIYKFADNLSTTTIEYASGVKAELIAIMTEQETSTMNILLGPYAQQLVNHSPIPVLSVHAKEIYDYQTKTYH